MRCISDVKGGVRSGFCLRLFPEQFIPSDIFAGKRIADIEEQDRLRILFKGYLRIRAGDGIRQNRQPIRQRQMQLRFFGAFIEFVSDCEMHQSADCAERGVDGQIGCGAVEQMKARIVKIAASPECAAVKYRLDILRINFAEHGAA